MITRYDYLVIGFYFVFMLAIGVAFRPFSRDSSDYFRGGGSMLWWMCGASAFMVNFSAWSFTGAAGEIYRHGTLILTLFLGNAVAFFLVYLFTSYRYRQMRTVTFAEAVNNRFGRSTEQFYVWIQIPLFLWNGAIYLNAVGVFVSSVFEVSMGCTILLVGAVVLFMSVTGGAWAVVASDFVQMLIIATISILTAALALSHPAVGGISGLIRQVPSSHFDWIELMGPQFILFMIVGLLLSQCIDANNMARGASRFLMVKDGRHARKASLVPLFGMIVFPAIWLIPPMAANITHPNIAAEFPALKNPAEASYVAICMATMPQGMIGLLVCGIFAATMSTMDSGMNRSAGIFIRNFFKPFLNQQATERQQLLMGKVVTGIFGSMVIVVALLIDYWREANLFTIVLDVAVTIEIPLVVPLLLGMFIKRTPGWGAWTTALLGVAVALAIYAAWNADWLHGLFPSLSELAEYESYYLRYCITMVSVVILAGGWYLFTSLWYTRSAPVYRDNVDEFFETMNRPIDPIKDQVPDQDRAQYHTLGLLCLIYGGFVLLLTLIPNSSTGRLCFVFCGGSILTIGAILYRKARRMAATA